MLWHREVDDVLLGLHDVDEEDGERECEDVGDEMEIGDDFECHLLQDFLDFLFVKVFPISDEDLIAIDSKFFRRLS